jgi:xanthine dehydrogenase YagR molybdenum-binding subunit
MTDLLQARAIGQDLPRLDGRLKVTGRAPYAYEQPVANPAYLYLVQSTVARGRIAAIDTAGATAMPGVLMVITHENAPRLASNKNGELWVLQSADVSYRGEIIGAVLAETPEIARDAAGFVRVTYEEQPHDVRLRADHPGLYAPPFVNPHHRTDAFYGHFEPALSSSAVTLDKTYTTPMQHHNSIETHSTVAVWDSDAEHLFMYDGTQSVHATAAMLAEPLGLDLSQVHIVSPYIGGAFGAKAYPKPHHIAVVMAARLTGGRPVRFALTRQQSFDLATYRTPTIQRLRLAADPTGRLSAIGHDVVEQTSRIKEYAEQTALPSRVMYAAPNRRTTHRLAPLDVSQPGWMRAPGETPGMYAGEVAMDEMAQACGLDPIEFRLRNDTDVDPDSGKPFSSRNLAACLREGARRFGWEPRGAVGGDGHAAVGGDGHPRPGTRRVDGWLVGTGVASSTYPVHEIPGSTAVIHYGEDGCYQVRIGAADLGTGTWTTLTQIAADALGRPVTDIRLQIGDSVLPMASVAAGSSGIHCWGSTIVAAAAAFRAQHGADPAPGAEARADMPEYPDRAQFACHSFGAQFAEVRVDVDTGEIRVPRMLGVFAVGRIVNPRTARSQLIGGITMGLSMALFEQAIVDPRFGHVVNRDLAEYHIPTNADVKEIEAVWIDEWDPHLNPMGTKGIGEIGIVGAAAAVANAVHDATGIRVRDLPITADKVLR